MSSLLHAAPRHQAHATVAFPRPNPPSLGEKAGRRFSALGARSGARRQVREPRANWRFHVAGFWPVGRIRRVSGIPWPGSEFVVPGRIRAWAALEIGAGRLLPWFAVAYGTGIVLYFTAEREPASWAAIALAAFAACNRVCGAAQHVRLSFWRLTFAAAAPGFAVATLKTAWIAHPVLRRSRPGTSRSAASSNSAKKASTTTASFCARTRSKAAASIRCRSACGVTVRTGTAPPVGSFVEFKPSCSAARAARPGGYDFARDIYFSGIGASGFVLGRINSVAPPVKPGAWLRCRGRRGHARWHRQAHPRRHSRRRGRNRLDADHRPARHHYAGSQDAFYVSSLASCAVDLRLSHGGGGRAGVLLRARRPRLDSVAWRAGGRSKNGPPPARWSPRPSIWCSPAPASPPSAPLSWSRSCLSASCSTGRADVPHAELRGAGGPVFCAAGAPDPSFQLSFAATLALIAAYQYGLPWHAKADTAFGARVALWGGPSSRPIAFASLVAGLATTPYAASNFYRLKRHDITLKSIWDSQISWFVISRCWLGWRPASDGSSLFH